jgi:chemotaxis protein MotB
MRKLAVAIFCASIALTGCVSKKKYTKLQAEQTETADKLSAAKLELADCRARQESNAKEVAYLQSVNYKLLNNVGKLSTLSSKEAGNLEKSLESIREKDLQIKSMRDALTKKDSVTLALITSLKGALGNLDDEDVQVQVEKGVVFVSLSDKLLFKSGSYEVSERAKEVLAKVAKVINAKPELEIMVEGHTDNKAYQNGNLVDNWDLSTKRATSIVRILQKDFNVKPERLVAAGRSYYVPLSTNETAEGRSNNRRTRIVVLPKLDQFYSLIEEGMKEAK